MSTLYITEFTNQGTDMLGRPSPIAALMPVAQQTVSISAGSLQSAVLNASTTLVRINTDSSCSLETGVNPTATTAKMRMPADSTEYFGVQSNSGLKIAVIAN
jgi:hypothetical protein